MNIRERGNVMIDTFFACYILPGIIVDDSLANILFPLFLVPKCSD